MIDDGNLILLAVSKRGSYSVSKVAISFGPVTWKLIFITPVISSGVSESGLLNATHKFSEVWLADPYIAGTVSSNYPTI